ncbi:Wzz/FepE/Etk N-terminal domain-containing protein [Alkalibacillus salilacus]|uniref:Capsular polysaccharide biosynthesis protein n=1 Tax=Alkalibacillus salilacus TaxID=284582 RepID=A0ABT9VHW0_9BACI|nr:Wzz/FepE/Etk N-terminal domain-containing protein [Alkalibacillus salilacus]MDQ0160546.1 capsular polysaccharide biosynthesis protein [Alkalibacillus salilacus]
MEEEISLREIINRLWEGKWIIAGVTVVAILISFIVSYFIMSPTYQADTTVRVSQPNYQLGTASDYVSGVVGTDIFVRTAESPEVLSAVLEEETQGNRSVNSLNSSLTFEVGEAENPSIIDIKISGGDKQQITNLLHSVITKTTNNLSTSVQDQLSRLEEQYSQQAEEKGKELQTKINEYSDMQTGSGLPSLVLFEDIASSSQFLLEANEEMMSELRDLDKVAQIEFEQINDEIDRLYEDHNTYVQYLEDVQSAQSLNVVEESIHMISEPYAGDAPVSPNKILNLAISLVLGLMVGVFVVFIRAYMKETK